MKVLVKSLLFAMTFACLFTACKDDDEKTDETQAKFQSFGFYAEDNEGVLTADYVVNAPGSAIDITMPDTVNKAALVARFTTSENDVVTIEGEVQESGVTVNDFRNPVDYIVSEGLANTRYTVSVKRMAERMWTKIAVFEGDSVSDIVMRVNPADNIPYVAYIKGVSSTTDRKLAAVQYANGQWKQLGSVDGISAARAGNIDLAFSNTGVPYVAYSDYGASISQKPTVQSFDGTSWNLVGEQGFNDVRVTYKALGFDANNVPMLFAMNDGTGTLPKRAINVCRFVDDAWETGSTVSSRPATTYSYYPRTKLVNGTLYLAIFNAGGNPQTYSIYTYKNNSWTTVIEQAKDAAASNTYLSDMDLAVDAQ
ncbi:MAG: hypothetical protein LBC40_06530, partial [Dysgonamonadaceae bacterium]|nr:hypothetical protein [Dysgonamonadaceae bacterium]